MKKNNKGKVLSISPSGKLVYVSTIFMQSEQFRLLGWKVFETPDADKQEVIKSTGSTAAQTEQPLPKQPPQPGQVKSDKK